jgi:hypothetical protein
VPQLRLASQTCAAKRCRLLDEARTAKAGLCLSQTALFVAHGPRHSTSLVGEVLWHVRCLHVPALQEKLLHRSARSGARDKKNSRAVTWQLPWCATQIPMPGEALGARSPPAAIPTEREQR